MDNLKFLNAKLISGDIIMDEKSLLTQSFHTKDGKIVVTCRRIGGGFTCGSTQYALNGERMSLDAIYAKTVNHFLS